MRFFCPQASTEQKIIELTDPHEIHHLRNVFRLKEKDQIRIFNARDEEFAATIVAIKKNSIEIRPDYLLPPNPPKSTAIVLACALPKRAKFEFIIEKCTELGVDEIIPLKTRRTEVSVKEDRREQKAERFRKIAVNAAKQCGRRDLPVIHPVTLFTKVLEAFDSDHLALIPCLSGSRQNIFRFFRDRPPSPVKKIVVLIGPEGDFTPEEVRLAVDSGCVPVSLGPTVLKVDTAAVSAVAFLNFFLNTNV